MAGVSCRGHPLAKYDLELELLGYGFNKFGNGFIFEVANPGKVILHNLRGYAAIGSGSLMALAALNRRPKTNRLPETIYRLLDAKFSSETARDVGKTTHVVDLHCDGTFNFLKRSAIEKIREVWLEEQKQPDPSEAMDIIEAEDSYTIRKLGEPPADDGPAG
jgi:20S proteasome alpha/beta subunit